MWFEQSVFYQIYPLGFCGAPRENDGVVRHGLLKVLDFTEHLVSLNIGAVYFCPIFQSSTHGYDTSDYSKIDVRLGTNEDFAKVCSALHEKGIRVVLDGVFNHVGRDFFAFRDVIEKKWDSQYKDWFYINFNSNDAYNDGFWYEGWEGHYELVKLNLDNPSVREYLFGVVGKWIGEFGIDGIRLDVAYMLNRNFMKELRSFCLSKRADFFLVGEMIHGNYNDIVNSAMLHSATNYECYKGIYSSLNSMNMFEIGHSLNRQFGSEPWCLYRGMKLFNFVDNHDVTRIADCLTNKNHIKLAFALLMSMPGIPCIYYGSEWGIGGRKEQGDDALRPYVDAPISNGLTEIISGMARVRQEEIAFADGDYATLHLTNHQIVYRRSFEGQSVIVAINAAEEDYTARFDTQCSRGYELLYGKEVSLGGELCMPGYSVQFIKVTE